MVSVSASGSGIPDEARRSGFLVEGFGDEVIHALTVMACFAIPTFIWLWQNRRYILPAIHPAQLGLVEEVRRRLGFNERGGGGGPTENGEQVPTTLDPAGVPQPPPNIPRYQLDATCPICFGICRFAILTNCGHRFCTSCIVTYWRVGRWIGDAVECPVCRVRVSLLMPDFLTGGVVVAEGDGDETIRSRNEAVAEIREYNRRFSGLPRSFMDYIRDAPVLLRHLWHRLFTLGGLMLIFRLRIILCFAAMFLYVLSPLDILPEAVFGLLGVMDDLFIVGIALFYIVALYRHYVGQGNVFD